MKLHYDFHGHGRPHLARLLHGVVGREVQADAVDAVALVGGRGEALALEDVAQVASAVGADDLGAGHAKGVVRMAGHGARDAVKVGGPAASRLELVRRLVQRRLAAGARVDARLRVELVILAGSGGLCALLPQDSELLCCC